MMNSASAFAIHFGRLLSQRVREPNNAEAHRAALGEVTTANAAAVTLTWDNWQLRAGTAVLPATEPGMLELLGRMAAHGIRELSFDAGTDRAHLLGVAWILAHEPKIGDGGTNAMARLRLLDAADVRMVPIVAEAAGQAVEAAVQSMAARPSIALTREEIKSTVRPSDEPEAAASVDGLVGQLSAANTADQLARVLNAMATFNELPQRQVPDMIGILFGVMNAEARLTDPEASRVFRVGVKRIAKAGTFRSMAAAMSVSPDLRDDCLRVFAHFGDDAADQVIEQLAHAESSQERRILFDALVELKRGVPTLIYLLGDGRWYVVRNAAELLGEMRATEAEPGLVWLLSHADQRVRQSATSALAKLETPGARAALNKAIRDQSRDVRMHATLALGATKERSSVSAILRALAEESDPEVQRTLLASLARIGTPEAVQHLVDVAGPTIGVFKKKSTPLRVAAVEALADCKVPDAMATVRSLTKDREREVREAATRALTPGKSTAAVLEVGRRW